MSTNTAAQMGFFERYLSVWVLLCMGVGVALGIGAPDAVQRLSAWEFVQDSHVNAPIAVLIWLMIYPMMLKIEFAGIRSVARRPKGLIITLVVNWLVKPFSMAFLGWFFLRVVFAPWVSPVEASNYTAGLIILAAAPCTAMVFVWSQLTDGDPAYTLAQVALNDLIMLVAFAPIVMLLLGVAHVVIPTTVLATSVVVFIVVPLAAGFASRKILISAKGLAWFQTQFLPRLQPVTILALLATLVLIFAFQAENLTRHWLVVVLLAIPILAQVYFNSSLTYLLMKFFKVPHNIAAPGALIGASNFFELAVAVAITLFGPSSGAALATVVGVLVEVPVMLTVCQACNRSRGWYNASLAAPAQ